MMPKQRFDPNTRPERDSMERADATKGLENVIAPENAIEGYQAMNDDHSLHEEVARVAYGYYLERAASGGPGSPEEDWNRAEQEVSRRRVTSEFPTNV